MPDEPVEYRDIAGFPGYRVGNDGSVWTRRTRKAVGLGRGSGFYAVLGPTWHKMKPQRNNKSWHLAVTLSDRRKHLVHRLVLEAFVGPCPPGMEARHFPDRNPRNNALGNLIWGTRKENMGDRVAHGTDNRGEKHNMVKITATDVLAIRRLRREQRLTIDVLAAQFGITRSMVSLIILRKAWRHIPEELDLQHAQEELAAGRTLPEGFVVELKPYLTIR